MGQAGIIHKLNYLGVTWIFNRSHACMFFRKWYWHLVSKHEPCVLWIIVGVKPTYYLKLFWSIWCPEISFSKKFVYETSSVSCQERRIYCIFSDQNFVMSFCITFKKKTSACGSQIHHIWITSGLLCGSMDQMGQQVHVTLFQPWSENH